MTQEAFNEAIDRILDSIESEIQGHWFTVTDDICYGSIASVEQNKRFQSSLDRIKQSVPPGIWDEHKKRKRQAEARKLRDQADKLDQGEPS